MSGLCRQHQARTRPPPTHRALALPLIATLALLIAMASGCRSTEPAPVTAPTTPPPPTPALSPSPSPDPLEAAEQAALDAYRGMWSAYVEASRIPDPEHPDLARHATADALQVLENGLETIANNGLASRGDVALDPRVTEVQPVDQPTAATISDCVDTSDTELYRTSGEPYQDTPGGPRLAEATVEDLGGGDWKVTGFALYGVGTCED